MGLNGDKWSEDFKKGLYTSAGALVISTIIGAVMLWNNMNVNLAEQRSINESVKDFIKEQRIHNDQTEHRISIIEGRDGGKP